MRVISGIYGGRKIKVPGSLDIRPTSDFIREALFNILGDKVRGKRFLDLYAGSGSVGIEALSRGASRVLFVEKSKRHFLLIEENLRNLGAPGDSYKVFKTDSLIFLRTCPAGMLLDFVFIDPPYRYRLYSKLLRKLYSCSLVGEDTVIIAEHSSSREISAAAAALELMRKEEYSSTALSFFKKA